MLTQAISGGVAQVRGLKMIRQTVQWIVYFVIVAALICGLEIVTGLPAQTQASLPLGTHLWIALWCVLGLMVIAFVRLSRSYPPLFIICTTTICALDWLVLGLKYSHITIAGLLSASNVEIISNVLNIAAIAVIAFSWAKDDDTGNTDNTKL